MVNSFGSLTARTSSSMIGIAAMIGSTIGFSVQDTLMKYFLEQYTLWNLMAFRWVITLTMLAVLILVLGKPHRLLSINSAFHAARAFSLFIAFICFYSALPKMGLAEAATIVYAAPLIIAVLALFMFKEKIGLRRGVALVIGFCGVVVAMRPSPEVFMPISLLPLVTAFSYALTFVLLRRVGGSETSLSVAFQTFLYFGGFIIAGGFVLTTLAGPIDGFPHLDWRWQYPEVNDLPLLLLLAACSVCGFVGISRAYQVASASVVAPFDYIYLAWATVLGFLIWGTVPDEYTIIGMCLIVCAGIYIGYREYRIAQQDSVAMKTSGHAVVPQND